MAKSSSIYLTRSVDGVWYYQRWIPKRLQNRKAKPLKKVYRVSTRTKRKREANRRALAITVKFDNLAQTHFDNPQEFARAMELVFKSIAAKARHCSFEEYEEDVLFDLDEFTGKDEEGVSTEYRLLEKGEAFTRSLSPPSADNAASRSIELSDEQNPTLDELVERWVEKKRSSGLQSLEPTYLPAVRLFVSFITELEGAPVNVSELRLAHIQKYQEFYIKLPKGAKTSSLSVRQLSALKGHPKSPSTIGDHFTNVATFLKWVEIQGYPIDSKLKVVLVKGSDVVVRAKDKKQRQPLNDEDLRAFFNSECYTSSGKFKTSAMYWAPLIALFTGARLSEILQLERHDIHREGRDWVIKFDDLNPLSKDKHKRLKQESSRRSVPVSKQLIDLGFIEYVHTQNERIFPDEPRNAHGKFDAFQKRQAIYRKSVGVAPRNGMEMKDFHSFRHTVRTRLSELRNTGRANQRFDEGLIDSIIGHASRSRSIGEAAYTHSQHIPAKRRALNRLNYSSIDFDKLIEWHHSDFVRAQYR